VPLPAVGEIYWVETWIFGGSDPKPRRPAVVVQVPSNQLGFVHVITRTSDTDVHGVRHPRDASIGCNEDGVFAMKHHRSALVSAFMENADLVGGLPEPYLSQVQELWETS